MGFGKLCHYQEVPDLCLVRTAQHFGTERAMKAKWTSHVASALNVLYMWSISLSISFKALFIQGCFGGNVAIATQLPRN